MEHVGGLIKKMPITAIFFLCGALAIGGLPPFNGFVSKFLLYTSLFETIKVENFPLAVAVVGGISALSLIGGISLLTFTKSFSIIFLGSPRTKYKQLSNERLSGQHLPFFIILFLMMGIGMFPSLVLLPIQRVLNIPGPPLPVHYVFDNLGSSLYSIGIASLLLIFLAGLIYFVRYKSTEKRVISYLPTWGCGYTAPNMRMQYTGKSFSKTLAKLFTWITKEQKKYSEIENTAVFPAARTYQSNYQEFFETTFINRASNQLLNFLNHFSFIHNGQIQRYILYGFIFIILLIVGTFFNIL